MIYRSHNLCGQALSSSYCLSTTLNQLLLPPLTNATVVVLSPFSLSAPPRDCYPGWEVHLLKHVAVRAT